MTNTIFITGSSTGLGKATAKYFASNGWNVIATMRSPEKETELNQAANILVLKMDVTDSKSISAAIKSGMERFGSIDVVVNNAGIGRYGALELVEDSAIDTTWDTNIKGVINVIRGILPHFRSAKHGKIINVGSVVGLAAAMPLASLYAMSKFALEGLTEGLYYELKPLNIDIHMVEPGGFKSEFNSNVKLDRDAAITEYDAITDKIEHLLNHLTDDQLGNIEDVIDVIFKLATGKTAAFRNLVGKDSEGVMQMRDAMPIKNFLNTILENFS